MADKKPKDTTCEGWHLRNTQGSSDKFYYIYLSEDGMVVLRWGRTGSVGQSSVTQHATYDEARDVAQRQLYAKKSKGYDQQATTTFMASHAYMESARGGNPVWLTESFSKALSENQFAGSKDTVLAYYDNFNDRVKELLDRAATDDVFEEFQQLEEVYRELQDRHGETTAAFDLARLTLFQKMMS